MKREYERLALMAYGLMAAGASLGEHPHRARPRPTVKPKCGECQFFPEKSFCKVKGIKVTKNTLTCKNFKPW